MVVINKSLFDVYLTNVNFLVCYSVLVFSMFFLHRKEKLVNRLFFAVVSVPALAFLFDTTVDAFYFIPFRSLNLFSAYVIFLFPLYLYLGFMYQFSRSSFFSAFFYLFLGAVFELVTMKLGFNIPDITRYFWLVMFICMNVKLEKNNSSSNTSIIYKTLFLYFSFMYLCFPYY